MMTITKKNESAPQRPLRLWPGVVAGVLQGLIRFGLPIVVPGTAAFGLVAGLLCGLVIILWWAFFSRARWSERWGAILLMIVAMAATSRILHESIRTGMMGMLFVIYAIPILTLAFVAWAVASRRLPDGLRRVSMVATILLACGALTLVRTEGVTGDAGSVFRWRWTETPEERLLAQSGEQPAALRPVPAAVEVPKAPSAAHIGESPVPLPSVAAVAKATEERLVAKSSGEPAALPPASADDATGADWPGFRGPERDGTVRGVRINTDWSASPPVELWRRPVGPGWSSFAVRGGLFYTQEQRGEDEIVACYKAGTGEPVWRHRDKARFWESNAGAGPRATPALGNGRVYTFGATGIVNALDAADGAVVWSRNAASDAGVKIPIWGFASSPLVAGDVVVVAVAGTLVAYDRATGDPRWRAPEAGGGYSSPQLVTIDGVAQVLLMEGTGTISVARTDGALLWEHKWTGVAILQPALTANGDVLISLSGETGGMGIRRLAVAHRPGGWTVAERWTSVGLKPYFNDFVVHDSHAYGFDGGILACINLEDGKRTWKGGRYGHGQLVLLADQGVLLVLSEEGELALVRAAPDQFTELARFPAIEGKTWNHPVVAGDVLLVRNDREMAAFRLTLADR